MTALWIRYAVTALLAAMTIATTRADDPAPLTLDFPIVDMPYNRSDSYTAPSMRQSLMFTKNAYQYTHDKIARTFADNQRAEIITRVGFDVLMTWLPLGDSWLHEEWHRAVLGRYGITSYDNVYDLPLFADSIAVSHVRDADLVDLKREHPADLVRLHAAGLEAQSEFILALEKDAFFDGVRNRNGVVLWLNTLNSIAYLNTCASTESDTFTAQMNREDGTNIARRDFTGLDCTAWIYDLFRPDEPYADRGVHPSGIGIDRYISWSDLSDAEKKYLHRQRNLAFVNMANPFLFGHVASTATLRNDTPIHWNAALRHQLTSFGYVIDADVFLQSTSANALIALHAYYNRRHRFPGISVEAYRIPTNLFGGRVSLSTILALWQQPKRQSFTTAHGDSGGQVALRGDYPLDEFWAVYVETDWKSNGWVAGNTYLDDNLSLRIGTTARWK